MPTCCFKQISCWEVVPLLTFYPFPFCCCICFHGCEAGIWMHACGLGTLAYKGSLSILLKYKRRGWVQHYTGRGYVSDFISIDRLPSLLMAHFTYFCNRIWQQLVRVLFWSIREPSPNTVLALLSLICVAFLRNQEINNNGVSVGKWEWGQWTSMILFEWSSKFKRTNIHFLILFLIFLCIGI